MSTDPNIAGVIYNGPLMDVTKQQFEHLLAVNTVAVHMMTRTFLPLLKTHDRVRNKVINISLQSGFTYTPFYRHLFIKQICIRSTFYSWCKY